MRLNYYLRDTHLPLGYFRDSPHCQWVDAKILNDGSNKSSSLVFDWCVKSYQNPCKKVLLLNEQGYLSSCSENRLSTLLDDDFGDKNIQNFSDNVNSGFPTRYSGIDLIACTPLSGQRSLSLIESIIDPWLSEYFGIKDIWDFDIEIINWLSGYPWSEDGVKIVCGKKERELGVIRAQALKLYPVLELIFHANDNYKSYGTREIIKIRQKIFQAIDGKTSFIKVLNEVFPVWLVKRLNCLGLNDLFHASFLTDSTITSNVDWFTKAYNPFRFLEHAALLKPDFLPRDVEDWQNFILLSHYLERVTASFEESEEKEFLIKFYNSIKGSYKGTFFALEKSGWQDVTKDVGLHIVIPTLHKEEYHLNGDNIKKSGFVNKLSARLLWKDRTLNEILRICDWWHERSVGLLVQLNHKYPNNEALTPFWSEITACFTASNGCTVECLTSENSLKTEGSKMHHCVGHYSSSCLYREEHILSIRENGTSLSTLRINEIALKSPLSKNLEQKNKAYIPATWLVEHRGFQNGAPPEKANQALEEWITLLKQGGVTIDFLKLEGERKLREQKHREIRNRSNLKKVSKYSIYHQMNIEPYFATSSAEAIKDAFAAYSAILPNKAQEILQKECWARLKRENNVGYYKKTLLSIRLIYRKSSVFISNWRSR